MPKACLTEKLRWSTARTVQVIKGLICVRTYRNIKRWLLLGQLAASLRLNVRRTGGEIETDGRTAKDETDIAREELVDILGRAVGDDDGDEVMAF